MPPVELKGINTVRKRLADGTIRVYYYHRATGIRLTGEHGTLEFIQSYLAAEKSMQTRLDGTLNGLIRDYTASPEFGKRRESTQREYKRMLTKVEQKFGAMPISLLDDPRIRRDFMEWRAKVAKESGEREADNRLSVVSAMLTWGVRNGIIFNNHVRNFERLYHSDRSDIIWLPEHVEAFMEVAPVELQRVMIVALHTGLRQGDIRRLKWSHYDGEALDLRESKRGREVVIPCTRALKSMLDGMEPTSEFVLTTKTGCPWQKRYLSESWTEAEKLAGLAELDLHFHDLRGTAITMLSQAGSNPQQIAAITGHSLQTVVRILDKYLARTRAMAEQAIALFERAESTQFANRLQTRDVHANNGDAK